MRKIKFIAKVVRWFDKVNGNTYHSVQVQRVRDGKTIYCQFQYGYGEQYKHTALVAMAENKLLPKQYRKDKDGTVNYYRYERENNYPIEWIVTDGLKRDCVANGKG